MNSTFSKMLPSARGRILGGLYFLVLACGIVAQAVIADGFVVRGDALATTTNILAHPALYRLAYTLFLIEMLAQICVSLLFYDLLWPVDRSLARIAAVIGVTGAGIKTFARLFYYAPLLLLPGASSLVALNSGQLAELSLTLIRLNNQGAAIALVFFGVETLLRGSLIFRSGFLPRWLGIVSMIGGAGWLTFLWPPLGSRMFPFVAVFAILGSLATIGWLFLRGVEDVSWQERALQASNRDGSGGG